MNSGSATLAAALADRYELLRELGRGGMATVYLARDVRHARQVAIKVLHPELAAVLGAERFLAEIKTTANLQHPHILPLFDSGSADGQLFYVMPFVEGETLRARLDRETQLPIADAVQLAREVADALQHAHDRGVIHRDIKPENILLQGGHALVADFGIALAVQQAGGQRMTQTGLSLGTPQYMAPEQAMGEKAVDARADLYALGAVTYEMLAGEPPFSGPTPQAIVAKVISTEAPRLDTLRRNVPEAAVDAVHTALEKLPADRFASAVEFAAALVDHAGRRRDAASRGRRAPKGATVPWWAWTTMAGSLALAFAMWWTNGRAVAPSVTSTPLITAIPLPDSASVVQSGLSFALSHDGRSLVYLDRQRFGAGELVLRSLDSLDGRALAGTVGATTPFWSPDDRHIGFFAEGELRVVDLATRSVRRGCKTPAPNGGTWGANDIVLISPLPGSIHRTTGALGGCVALSLAPLRRPEKTMSPIPSRPQFLGDGVHFMYVANDSAYLAKIDESWSVPLGDAANGNADIALPDHLLRRQGDGTYVQRIDIKQRALVGEPRRILPPIEDLLAGGLKVSASGVGSLAARLEVDAANVDPLVHSSVTGARLGTVPRKSRLTTFALSRNARTLAMAGAELQLLDLERGVATPLYAPEAGSGALTLNPVFSPGDTLLAFSRRRNRVGIDLVDVRTGTVRRLLDTPVRGVSLRPSDWSRDGTHLLYSAGRAPDSLKGIWTLDVASGHIAKLFDDKADVSQARYSPDERWIAYVRTDADGRHLYLRAANGTGVPVRVSERSGLTPRWRRDGHALYFVAQDGTLYSVEIESSPALRIGRETVVFPNAADPGGEPDALEPLPDGSLLHLPPPSRRPLYLILNWPALLKDSLRAR